MAHSIIPDEINAGTLKDSSWASLNVNKYQHMYSISSIEKHVISRAGLRGGQIGQLPGAPNFGGPMHYL